MKDKKESFEKNHIEDLVQNAKNGDTKAFGKLYDLFITKIFRFIYSRIGNRDDTEDIVSEIWKTIWLNLKKYKRGNFQAYIFRIAYTTLVGFIRKRKKAYSLEEVPVIQDTALLPDAKLEKDEEKRKLYKALSKLPKTYAEVLYIRFIEEFSIKEAAEILQKSSIIVRVTQYRALKKLKKILKEL